MTIFSPCEIKSQIDACRGSGRPVLICGAARSWSSLGCEKGGADMLLHYSCSAARMMGKSSIEGCLDFIDFNALNESAAFQFKEASIPVIAAVNPQDARRDMGQYLRSLRALGYSGVCCFPNASAYSYPDVLERELFRLAGEQGLFKLAFVFNRHDAELAVSTQADAIIFHLGMQAAARNIPLEKACGTIQAMAKVCGTIPLFVHGGPTIAPQDVQYILQNTSAVGLLSGSTSDSAPAAAAAKSVVEAASGTLIFSVSDGVLAKTLAKKACILSVDIPEQLGEVVSCAGEIPVLLERRCYGETPDWEKLRHSGAAGIINRPALSRFSGFFAEALKESSLDFSRELPTLIEAKQHGFMAVACVTDERELRMAAAAGLDGAICSFVPAAADSYPIRLFAEEQLADSPVFCGAFIHDSLISSAVRYTEQAVATYKNLFYTN